MLHPDIDKTGPPVIPGKTASNNAVFIFACVTYALIALVVTIGAAKVLANIGVLIEIPYHLGGQ